MTAFPLCATCHGPAELTRKLGGQVFLWHRHVTGTDDHDFGGMFDNERRAAAHWAMTYARKGPASPLGGPVEAQVAAEAPQTPSDHERGLCGLARIAAMREPETPSESIRRIVRENAPGLRRLAGIDAPQEPAPWPHIPHHRRSPMEHERDCDEPSRFPPYTPEDHDAGKPWPATETEETR